MTSYQNDDEGFERKTVGLFSTDSDHHNPLVESLHTNMFLEDVRLQVMPIGGRSDKRTNFSIDLDPEDASLRAIIIDAIESENYYRTHSLTEAMCEFIENVSWLLAIYGRTHYEIVEWKGFSDSGHIREDKIDTASQKRFHLTYIPGRVIRLGHIYLQILPRSEWSAHMKRFIPVPKANIWEIWLPEMLGSPHHQRTMLRSLSRSSTLIPDFVMESMQKGEQVTGFNFLDYNRQQGIVVTREAAHWGWNGRDLWNEYTTQYFRIYRQVKFEYSLAILREHVLSSLNSLLSRLGFSSRLVIYDLPTAQEINDLIERLRQGQVSFQEAIDFVNF